MDAGVRWDGSGMDFVGTDTPARIAVLGAPVAVGGDRSLSLGTVEGAMRRCAAASLFGRPIPDRPSPAVAAVPPPAARG